MNNEIEFIYSLNTANRVIRLPFDDVPIYQSKDDMIEFASSILELPDVMADEVVKVSICIYADNIAAPPQWFLDCNGKIYKEDIDKWLKKVN